MCARVCDAEQDDDVMYHDALMHEMEEKEENEEDENSREQISIGLQYSAKCPDILAHHRDFGYFYERVPMFRQGIFRYGPFNFITDDPELAPTKS